MDGGDETIAIPHLIKFVTDCFLAAGVPKNHSEVMAAAVVESDIMGHSEHGIFKLETWVMDAQDVVIDVYATPKIDKESSAAAWVDGRNALGPVVAEFCMKLAIQKAKNVGAAIVVAKHSNNFGVTARYSRLAMKEGLIGWACTNSSPYLVPTRAKNAASGTNPISFGAPGLLGDYFLIDMATTVSSAESIEMRSYHGEYLPIGVAMNAACLPETNADVAMKSMRYLPLGSDEQLGSYKGTGLSIMIDILCGVLSGSFYGPNVGMVRTKNYKRKANIGHCFIVIDPKRFESNFELRTSDLVNSIRGLEPINISKPVLVPGDIGREMMRKIEETGEIWFPKHVIESLKNAARIFKLKCVPFIPKPTTVVMTASEELTARLEQAEVSELLIEETKEEVIEEFTPLMQDLDELIIEDSWDWLEEFDDAKSSPDFRMPIGSVVVASIETLSQSIQESLDN
ncbi:hypothetical protein HHI36_010293 [Cryptolaemus montrouzieri]|uniref:Malate dehydrogenase n=1 Tax=Cryptolaemus montrouzieri TaxID=559131 RepID=A0ABD2MIA8_9CUCU